MFTDDVTVINMIKI